MCVSAVTGALGVSGIAARAVAQDDGGQAPGGCAVWSLQRGGGAQGTQEPVWTPQGAGREGTHTKLCINYN